MPFAGKFEGELNGFSHSPADTVGTLSPEEDSVPCAPVAPVPFAATPCSSFVVVGSSDGRLHVFDTRTELVSSLATLTHVPTGATDATASAAAPVSRNASVSSSATPAADIATRVIDCVAFHPTSAVLAFTSHAPVAGRADPDLCFWAPQTNQQANNNEPRLRCSLDK